MNENNNFSNENNTQEIEFPTLVDGTDISMLDDETRKAVHLLSKDEIVQWQDAYETAGFFVDEMENGNALHICSGDYIFPQNTYGIFMGYIVRVRVREWDGTEYFYLDTIFGNNMIKTIRCIPSLLSDKVSTAIRERFGRLFKAEDLVYSLIRIKVRNKLNDENEVTYSEIVRSQIIKDGYEKFLIRLYNAIIEPIYEEE